MTSEDEFDGPEKREPPVMPTAAEAAAAGEDRADAPTTLVATLWLWIVAGLAGLIGAILFTTIRSEWAAEALRGYENRDEIAKGLSVFLIVGSLMFLVTFALLAYKASGGTRKARNLLVVVGVGAALFQYGFGRVGLLGLVSALLILVAIGMLYLPATRKFFAESNTE